MILYIEPSIDRNMEGFCACNCGEAVVKWKYKKGHAPKKVLKPCACGCKELTKGTWVKGHDKRKPPKPLNPCACGCEEMVEGIWAQGHYARVHNPSKDPEVQKKQGASASRRIAEGERTFAGWNKGLTAETDERVAQNGKSVSQFYEEHPEARESRAEQCSMQWETGRIRPPRGSECGQWKGGVSTITQRVRAGLTPWRFPIMKRDGFRCTVCGRDSTETKLCVHHDKELFSDIQAQIVGDLNVKLLSFEDQGIICQQILDYHLKNNVSGITLCYDCHDHTHETVGDID